MQSPAERVIEKCGGPQATASILGVHVSNVHRWKYPKERGGSDGRVPGRHQYDLIVGAREKGIDLRPEDFFDLEALGLATADSAPTPAGGAAP